MACKYCEELDGLGQGADIIDNDKGWTDKFHIRKFDGVYRIECYADESSPINFCPMCGRNLNEDVCCGTESTNAGNVNP